MSAPRLKRDPLGCSPRELMINQLMINQSMFGELAIRLSDHPENTATEALKFVLTAHRTAWPSFRTFLAQAAVNFPDRLTFRTQKGGADAAVPDLVGSDHEGNEVL